MRKRNDAYPEYDSQLAFQAETVELINKLMRREGVTRAELARRLGVTKRHVTRILNRERNMSLSTIARIFFALGYEPEIRPRRRFHVRP